MTRDISHNGYNTTDDIRCNIGAALHSSIFAIPINNYVGTEWQAILYAMQDQGNLELESLGKNAYYVCEDFSAVYKAMHARFVRDGKTKH